MNDIAEQLRRHYSVDGTEPEHPIRRAIAEIERLTAERDALRAFGWDVMVCWPIGAVDRNDLHDAAVKHGLLVKQDPRPTAPCGPTCVCVYDLTFGEWPAGVECWMKTPLLTGGA